MIIRVFIEYTIEHEDLEAWIGPASLINLIIELGYSN